MSGMLDDVSKEAPLLWVGSRPIFQFCGAEGEGSGDGNGGAGANAGAGAGGAGQQTAGEVEDGKGSEGKNGEEDKTDPKLKAANDEAARRRHEAAAEKKRADDLAVKLKEYEDKDKGKEELLERDKKAAEAERDTLRTDNQNLRLQNAFLMDTTREWQNPMSAWKLLDKSDVKFGDDDKVEGLAEAIKKLAESDAYLLKDKKDGKDDKGGKGGGQHGASGSSNNGSGGDKGKPDRASMERKYPALRR